MKLSSLETDHERSHFARSPAHDSEREKRARVHGVHSPPAQLALPSARSFGFSPTGSWRSRQADSRRRAAGPVVHLEFFLSHLNTHTHTSDTHRVHIGWDIVLNPATRTEDGSRWFGFTLWAMRGDTDRHVLFLPEPEREVYNAGKSTSMSTKPFPLSPSMIFHPHMHVGGSLRRLNLACRHARRCACIGSITATVAETKYRSFVVLQQEMVFLSGITTYDTGLV